MWGEKLEKIKVENQEVLDVLDEEERENLLDLLEQARLLPYTCMPDECVLDVLPSEGETGPRIRVRRCRKPGS